MNKQEAIKKVEQMGEYERFVDESIPKLSVLNILNQLDEPQKVVVPQFVVDVIEGAREKSPELEDALHYTWGNGSKEFTEWYKKKFNRDLFARAWLDGYTIEKEPKYTVKIKASLGQYLGKYYLNNEKLTPQFLRVQRNEGDIFTKAELEEAGFGWVFDCPGIEIEEVE